MTGFKGPFKLYNESPVYQVIVALLIIFGVGLTLTIIFIAVGILISGADVSIFNKPAAAYSGNDLAFMRYLLIIQNISLFIIPSFLILNLLRTESETRISIFKTPQLKEIGLVIALAICLFPVTSITGEINSAMHLPHWLSGVEKWMVEQEDKADNLIDIFISTTTFPGMILNLIMIAILPAIGEELIFRGVFQKIFIKLFKSGHIAIWFTAILFSTLHFQFFGFVPRLILGVVFGYLFFWSGNLWLPIMSHFVNNAFPVIITYFQDARQLNVSTGISLWKQALGLPVPVTVCLIILFYFRNKSKRFDAITSNQE